MIVVSLLSSFDPWRSPLCTCPAKLTFNPYTGCDHSCIYCYASSYITDFSNCRPKKNLISKLRREAEKLRGEALSIANSSDPYPKLEAQVYLARTCLEILSKQDCKIQVITKSDLVIRDIAILKKTSSMVSMTITTDDDAIAELIEPHAPRPSERLKALRTLVKEGIPTSVRIDPIIPFMNDKPKRLIRMLASIGIKHITSSTLKVRPQHWKRFATAMPSLEEKLRQLYFCEGERIGRSIYLPKNLRLRLLQTVKSLAEEYDMRFGTCREGLEHMNTATCDGSWLMDK